MGAVKKAVGGATSFLVGGKEIPATQSDQAASADEQNRTADIESKIKELYANQGSDSSTDLFKQHLTDFLSGTHNATPSADELKQAQDFVNQTFTNPAQNALQQYESQFGANQQAQAAALGRNPNADQATNQAIFNEGVRQRSNISAEAGSRTAQQAMDLNGQNYNRSLSDLQAGMSGSGYLNNLAQQAFSNRLNLLNARSGINNYLQRDRLANITSTKGGTTSGVLTNLTSDFKGFNDFNRASTNYDMVNEQQKNVSSMIGGGSGGGGIMGMAAMA